MNKINPKRIRCELHMGSLCNYRCRYCFENGIDKEYKPTSIKWEYLDRYSSYIHYLKKTRFKDYLIGIPIFGGEPLMQFDNLERFVYQVSDAVSSIGITTNSALIPKYKDRILEMTKKLGNKLVIGISYDFCDQNITRCKDSYHTVRNNIRWMYNHGILDKTLTVISSKNIHRIHEIFFDYIELRKELPHLRCSFNVDRWGNLDDYDEEAARQSLNKIRKYMLLHPDVDFYYNDNVGVDRGLITNRECFYSSICMSLCQDGSVYPGYDLPYESEEVKKLFYIAHITEPFEEIDRKRLALLAHIPDTYPDICRKCTSPCRLFPWRVVKTSYDEWWDMPQDGHCRICKLIGEYFPNAKRD